jgi:hypothetical protein
MREYVYIARAYMNANKTLIIKALATLELTKKRNAIDRKYCWPWEMHFMG